MKTRQKLALAALLPGFLLMTGCRPQVIPTDFTLTFHITEDQEPIEIPTNLSYYPSSENFNGYFVPIRMGYDFLGWTLEPWPHHYPEIRNKLFHEIPDKSLQFYAVWEEGNTEIHANGGEYTYGRQKRFYSPNECGATVISCNQEVLTIPEFLNDSKVLSICIENPSAKTFRKIILPPAIPCIQWYSGVNSMPHLEEIILPRNLELIEEGVFMDCSSLKFLQFPKSLKAIQTDFSGCTSLKTLIFESQTPPIFQDFGPSFTDCPLEAVYVPDNALDAYQTVLNMPYKVFPLSQCKESTK